jgi:hypothetical protein
VHEVGDAAYLVDSWDSWESESQPLHTFTQCITLRHRLKSSAAAVLVSQLKDHTAHATRDKLHALICLQKHGLQRKKQSSRSSRKDPGRDAHAHELLKQKFACIWNFHTADVLVRRH